MWKIPLSDISLDDTEIEAVTNVLRSKWLTMGEVTQKFERAFADFIGVRHAFAVTNCTAALQLAYRVVGLQKGDEVIMPSLTFVATANAAVVEGATPVFADVASENDLTISPNDIRAKITPRTKAICVVHYAGHPCQMTEIMEIARHHQLAVVEDCAHSPGAVHDGCKTGAIGDVGCFSFFSNKNMTTGEGGMITTNRDDLAEKIRLLRSHGMTSLTLDRHKGHSFSYDVIDAGYNFRIDEMRSALGLVQLGKLEGSNARRRHIVEVYRSIFETKRIVSMPFSDRGEGSVFHIMPVLLEAGCDRKQVMTKMGEAGVQTSIHYPPVHRFSYYKRSQGQPVIVPRTENVQSRLLTLPLHPGMTADDVNFVVTSLQYSVEHRNS